MVFSRFKGIRGPNMHFGIELCTLSNLLRHRIKFEFGSQNPYWQNLNKITQDQFIKIQFQGYSGAQFRILILCLNKIAQCAQLNLKMYIEGGPNSFKWAENRFSNNFFKYIMSRTEIDLYGIYHVKVDFILVLKNMGLTNARKICLNNNF